MAVVVGHPQRPRADEGVDHAALRRQRRQRDVGRHCLDAALARAAAAESGQCHGRVDVDDDPGRAGAQVGQEAIRHSVEIAGERDRRQLLDHTLIDDGHARPAAALLDQAVAHQEVGRPGDHLAGRHPGPPDGNDCPRRDSRLGEHSAGEERELAGQASAPRRGAGGEAAVAGGDPASRQLGHQCGGKPRLAGTGDAGELHDQARRHHTPSKTEARTSRRTSA